MTTSFPSGLGASFGFTTEGTVGTMTTSSMRWVRPDKAPFALKKTIAQSTGLHQGLFEEGKRRAYVQREGGGTISMDLIDKQLGLFFQHALGAWSGTGNGTITQVGGSAAWLQNFYPGDTTGKSLSVQLGMPFTNGTIQPLNYPGCKILDFTISCQRGGLAKVDATIDGWDEQTSTGYAAPSFVASDVYSFNQMTVKFGGTPSTTSGVTSISAGAVPTGLVDNLSIKVTNPMKVDRFQQGTQTKQEQLPNNFRQIEVSFDIEWAAVADVYTAFAADTSTAMEITWTGGIAGGSNHFFVDIIIPQLFFEEASPPLDGPDVITQKVKAKGLDNGADNQIQLQYQSTDTSI
jgi:hypothetical protein